MKCDSKSELTNIIALMPRSHMEQHMHDMWEG